MRKYIPAAAMAVVLVVGASTALAGKPSSSLKLVPMADGARLASTAEPSYGDQITFEVSTTETDRPFVNLRCYQGDAFVADGWHGFFASYVPEPVFTLRSDYWTGGAADCTARLVKWDRLGRERTLATLDFHVGA
jgi:hypothetical protein